LTRRQFLKVAAWGAASTTGAVSLAHAAPRRLRISQHRVKSVWRGSSPLRVVQISDLHVGWATPKRLLHQAVREAHRARPHLVVLTGDYLNHTLKHLTRLRRLVATLPRPCIATLGNHDYWAGASEIQQMLEAEEIEVLRNSRTVFRHHGVGLPVVGVDDAHTDHDDVARAFAGLSSPQEALVLTHHPKTANAIAKRGARLILAGHTHGGQIQVPGVTRVVARIAGLRHIAGWYRVGPGRLYVNTGVGSSAIRWRVGRRAMPEVAIFDLV
jgi:predicted MPP superfamily phosphohydrolase